MAPVTLPGRVGRQHDGNQPRQAHLQQRRRQLWRMNTPSRPVGRYHGRRSVDLPLPLARAAPRSWWQREVALTEGTAVGVELLILLLQLLLPASLPAAASLATTEAAGCAARRWY
jgi:uncharacterized protein (DUF3820 family)